MEAAALSFEALITVVDTPLKSIVVHSHRSTSLTAVSVWQARLLKCFIILGNRWKSDGANDNYTEDGEEPPIVICSRDETVV